MNNSTTPETNTTDTMSEAPSENSASLQETKPDDTQTTTSPSGEEKAGTAENEGTKNSENEEAEKPEEKTFTTGQVNEIVQKRLSREAQKYGDEMQALKSERDEAVEMNKSLEEKLSKVEEELNNVIAEKMKISTERAKLAISKETGLDYEIVKSLEGDEESIAKQAKVIAEKMGEGKNSAKSDFFYTPAKKERNNHSAVEEARRMLGLL